MNKIYLLTGLPCSGKTTIGESLADRLGGELLDGDTIRNKVNNTDFSHEGRNKHMLAVADIAYAISKEKPVVVALVNPIYGTREKIKEKYNNVVEVYVECSLEACIKRDVKGMYAKAIRGEIKNFTGISDPYEPPTSPNITVNTEKNTVEDCINKILLNNYSKI